MDIRELQVALRPLHKLGLSQPALDAYFRYTSRLDQIEEVDPAIRDFTLEESEVEGEVLIPFTHSQGLTDHLLAFLGHAFRTRGLRPLFATCHGSLPLCFRKKSHPDRESTCIACQYRSNKILGRYGFEQLPLSTYATPSTDIEVPDDSNELKTFSYRGVDVSDYATATARRHLRKYRLNLDDPDEYEIFERYLRSAIHLVDATQSMLENRDVVAVVGNHPAYIYGGAPLETAAEYGVPAISYGGGYFREDAVVFGNMNNSAGFEMFSDQETLQAALQNPLTADESTAVEHYMNGRRDGSTIRELNQYIQSAQENIQIDSSKTVACMFTNLLWDGSLSGSAVTFEDPFQWVEETIDFTASLDDFHLILKPHPAEAHRETETQMAEWVRSEVDVPENVTVLDADTDVNPYELMAEIDSAIVLNSTVGMEAAYDGVPVITTGNTHYRELGFTHDPQTPDEYFDLLSELGDLSMSEHEKQLAKRYAHFLLVKRHITFEGLESVTEIHKMSHEQIAKSDTLDRVVEQILDDERSIRA